MHVLRGQRGEVGVDPSVELPEVVVGLARDDRLLGGESLHGEEQYLVVAEQAANRAGALPFQAPDEVDGADAVRPPVDEITEKPQARVAATPPLGSVHEPGVP